MEMKRIFWKGMASRIFPGCSTPMCAHVIHCRWLFHARRFPEIDPVFENSEVEEMPSDTPPKCDMCDVSWPDDAAGKMHRLTKLDIVTHQGCAQFAADVLAQYPNITTREQIIGVPNLSEVNRPGAFHVTVHRAMDLPGVQLLGTQTPYAKLSLLPWKEPFQTKPSENGGRNPLWKSMHDNAMQFSHMYNSTITPIPLLEVEIWNSNYISDDLVACTLLDMTPLLRYPQVEAKRWFTLSSRVQAPIAMMNHSTGQPKVLLSIKFVPLEGKYTGGNEHKFRVHHLKSIGLAIPNCAVCTYTRLLLPCVLQVTNLFELGLFSSTISQLFQAIVSL